MSLALQICMHGSSMICSYSTISVPAPTVTVTAPGGLYFATTSLTLTCNIMIASNLGSVAVSIEWSGPDGLLSGSIPTMVDTLVYQSVVTIDNIPTSATATYNCHATVDADPSSTFITAGMQMENLEISIGM